MKAESGSNLLEICLRRMESGESPEEILAGYPQDGVELRPLLEAAWNARTLQTEQPVPNEAQARSREKFLREAAGLRRREKWNLGWRVLSPLPLAASILGLFLIALIGTGFASAQALPGDSLYPVKRAAEQTRLDLAGSPVEKLDLEQHFDQERVGEVAALMDRRRSVEVDFTGFLAATGNPGEWQVASLKLVIIPDMAMDADLRPGDYVDVHGVPLANGKVMVEKIDHKLEDLKGNVQAIRPDGWTVDQVPFQRTAASQVIGNPQVGSPVAVRFIRRENGSLEILSLEVIGQAKNILETPTPKATEEEGLREDLPAQPTLSVPMKMPTIEKGETSPEPILRETQPAETSPESAPQVHPQESSPRPSEGETPQSGAETGNGSGD